MKQTFISYSTLQDLLWKHHEIQSNQSLKFFLLNTIMQSETVAATLLMSNSIHFKCTYSANPLLHMGYVGSWRKMWMRERNSALSSYTNFCSKKLFLYPPYNSTNKMIKPNNFNILLIILAKSINFFIFFNN